MGRTPPYGSPCKVDGNGVLEVQAVGLQRLIRGELIYFDPVRVHSTQEEPVDEVEVYTSSHDYMMGCDTTNASPGTGLPLIFVVTALFLGLIRRP